MTKTFTQDDVIRYLYQETSERENKEIEKELLCNAELQDIYKQLKGIVKNLDGTLMKPSEKVFENIMNYSKSLNLHPLK